MRFLSDENFRLDVIRYIESLGYDIKKAPKRSSDKNIINLAKKEKRILLTNDSDFSNSLTYPPYENFGILIFRIHPPSLIKFTHAFENFLEQYDSQLIKGKTIIIDDESILEME